MNDIHYNVNEIQKLQSQGIDTTNLIVAEPSDDARGSRVPRGTLKTTNDWIQTDPADGKIVIAWSMMNDYPYKNETTKFMAELRIVLIHLGFKIGKDYLCMNRLSSRKRSF